MVWRVLRAVRHYPWSTAVLAAAIAATAYTVSRTPRFVLDLLDKTSSDAQALGRRLAALSCALLAVGFVWWVVYWLVLPTTTLAWVARRDDEADHAGGVATRLDIAQQASRAAMRKRATLLRPSLAGTSWYRIRYHVPVTDYAVKLLTAGLVDTTSQVWSSCEEVVLRIGGPRSGKTGSMIPHVRTAPGPVVVTSTRTDLLEHTRAAREKRGEVLVFNPTGIGRLSSTVRWTPLAGCTDFATAQRRADDLIPPSTGEAERWDTQARGLLAVLLHAAALQAAAGGPGSMQQISRWLSRPDETTRTDIHEALAASADAGALQTEARAILTFNDRTLTSITATLRPAVRWASEATAADAGDAHPAAPDLFDVAAFVRGESAPGPGAARFDSLYLVGREGSCRPLVGALTAEIAHQARMAAAEQRSGRLDPPLSLFLDEAPLTCGPVPLHDWTADMGGRGVWMHITAQSLAQLRDCWGIDRAGAILANTSGLMIFGGIKSTDDLQQLSTLAGTRLRQLDADDMRPTPVMGPAEIQQLRRGQVLLIMNGLRPVVGAPDMGWPTPTRAALGAFSRRLSPIARAGAAALRRPVAALARRLAATVTIARLGKRGAKPLTSRPAGSSGTGESR